MTQKKLIAAITYETSQQAAASAKYYDENGADEILLDVTPLEDKDAQAAAVKLVANTADIPLTVIAACERFEDIKKILYAGARKFAAPLGGRADQEALTEGIARFGKEKIALYVSEASVIGLSKAFPRLADVTAVIVADYTTQNIDSYPAEREYTLYTDAQTAAGIESVLSVDKINAIASGKLFAEGYDIMSLKAALADAGISMNTYHSTLAFSSFKSDESGLVPVITQDYKTGEVLMLAYMNEASFNETIRSGRMTYYSRSRQELWKKGDTSGHYQFVKSLDIDCDKDTILAKVSQVGAACHTGSRTCFYTNLVKKEYDDRNPALILEQLMDTITDRKENPKEGSYTNYLFEKGIDKILKKLGEEATEIIIAAKNPDSSEIKYEIADFLYHMMVLMAERDVTWKEIMQELAERH